MSTPPIPPPGCPAHGLGLGPGGLRRLYGPEAEADPLGLYEQLRHQHGQVAPVLVQGDLMAWLVLGHRENLHVLRNPSQFSRDSRLWRDMAEGRVPPEHPLTPVAAWQPVANFVDGSHHKRLRGAVTEALGRFDRRGIRTHVTRFANQLIEHFESVAQADLVADFAERLPMLVMCRLIGLPESETPRLVEAALDMIAGTDTAVASNAYITTALQQLVVEKRERPGHDVASYLIAHWAELSDEDRAMLTDDDRSELTFDEIVVEHLRLVLIGAFTKTANLISSMLHLVVTDRRFRTHLSGGQMTLPDALDQVLWDAPPLTSVLGRWATSDTKLAGQLIKAGDMVLLGLAAGNVDPAARPDLTAPVHGNRSHLAFGSGPHECPGEDIALAIADTGIDTLLARLPDIQLAVDEADLRWTSSLMSRNLTALPVTFEMRLTTPAGPTKVSDALPPEHRNTPLPAAMMAPAAQAASGGKAPCLWSRLFGG
ncbi:cytochrome P450 [Streptomyces lydicus]|uniref:cytochrome P450 n=1 Tax=Streptomyces lydicus TaxID=47763 RepID=UPI0036E2DD0B